MDEIFDHEDPNNRPEEIPLNDLDNDYDDDNYNGSDNDEYFDAYDNPYRETSFISGGEVTIDMVDEEGRPIERLDRNYEAQILEKYRVLKTAFLQAKGKEWNADTESLSTRDFLNKIEIKGDKKSIWYDGKIVFKKVNDRYVYSEDKRSIEYINRLNQELKNTNEDFKEMISSRNQKIGELITVNTVYKNELSVNIPVEIEVKPRIKGIIDNALNFDPIEAESPETKVNELENALYDIKEEFKKTDPENTEIRRYYLRLIDYLENNIDILRMRSGLSPKYNNLEETDYGRLRRLKYFLKETLE